VGVVGFADGAMEGRREGDLVKVLGVAVGHRVGILEGAKVGRVGDRLCVGRPVGCPVGYTLSVGRPVGRVVGLLGDDVG
jgi:hypothetical protein